VFKSYSIRSEVWRLWRPKKAGQPGAPRGWPEPSRLEGHVTAVSLIKICLRIVAAGGIIRKIPEAVVGEGGPAATSMLYWGGGDLAVKRANARQQHRRAARAITGG